MVYFYIQNFVVILMLLFVNGQFPSPPGSRGASGRGEGPGPNRGHPIEPARTRMDRLCQAQCVANCFDRNEIRNGEARDTYLKDCQSNCTSYVETLPDESKHCDTPDCLPGCIIQNKTTGDTFRSGLHWQSENSQSVLIQWDPPAPVPRGHTVYVVQMKEMGPNKRWTNEVVTSGSWASLSAQCSAMVKILAVTRTDVRPFTNQTEVQNKPPKVRNLHRTAVVARPDQHGKDMLHSSVEWSLPHGWNSSDILNYKVKQSAIGHEIPVFDILNSETPMEYPSSVLSNFADVRVLAIPELEKLKYTVTVYAVSKCGINGMEESVLADFSDCQRIINLTRNCPTHRNYPKPDPVNLETVEIVVSGPAAVNITWQTVHNADVAHIEGYAVAWGVIMDPDEIFLSSLDMVETAGVARASASDYVHYTATLTEEQRQHGGPFGVKIAAIPHGKTIADIAWGFLTAKEFNLQFDTSYPFENAGADSPEPEPGSNSSKNNNTQANPSVSVGIGSTQPRKPKPTKGGPGTVEPNFRKLPQNVPPPGPHEPLIIASSVSAALGTIILLGILYFCRRRYKLRKKEAAEFFNNDEVFPSSTEIDRMFKSSPSPEPVADKWEIPHSRLSFGESIGHGAFGQVLKGVISGYVLTHRGSSSSVVKEREEARDMTVAIKMLPDFADGSHRAEFLREIALMKALGNHPNIVSIIACCTIKDPLCLMVEHMSEGDLLHYLRKHRSQINQSTDEDAEHLTYMDLLSFARQIAVGMEYLAQKGYVHRDLATRNILVGEQRNVKIGDFGLTRYVYDDKIYVTRKGGKLPLKWMSIEAIFDLTFSTQSDIWSYGVVLFELVTLGGVPYPTIHNRDLLDELKAGYRMERPDNCKQELYSVMLDCWHECPDKRPSFSELRNTIDKMMEEQCSDGYLDLNIDENKDYYRVSGYTDVTDTTAISSGIEIHSRENSKKETRGRLTAVGDIGQVIVNRCADGDLSDDGYADSESGKVSINQSDDKENTKWNDNQLNPNHQYFYPNSETVDTNL